MTFTRTGIPAPAPNPDIQTTEVSPLEEKMMRLNTALKTAEYLERQLKGKRKLEDEARVAWQLVDQARVELNELINATRTVDPR